jgi:hypothetical protein
LGLERLASLMAPGSHLTRLNLEPAGTKRQASLPSRRISNAQALLSSSMIQEIKLKYRMMSFA